MWKRYYARIRVLLEYAPRLQHFSLDTDESPFVCGVCELLQEHDLPNLLTLALVCEGDPSFEDFLGARIPTCPNLKSLTLAALPIRSYPLHCFAWRGYYSSKDVAPWAVSHCVRYP